MNSDDRGIKTNDKKDVKEPREKDKSGGSCGCGCIPPIETK